MAIESEVVEVYTSQMRKIYEDASYSSQAYFEAVKYAEMWGRAIVFVPAILGAIAGILVALNYPKEWGSVGAVAGTVAATASFLGTNRNSASFKVSAREFTKIRHKAALEISLASRQSTEIDLDNTLRSLRSSYDTIVETCEPVPSRPFAKAQKRIQKGVLEYEGTK
ncbi:SLATT domain-containing protein [Amycolatopsis jejuensis]|uniref:SLATT domain-containing protein n=1 Tax=Amycolatopsis jejuensis TaxID=330084 RepID=UPI0012DFF5B3|nr:SLATT domain-containing protein [Amycolatopsis jejuensis]